MSVLYKQLQFPNDPAFTTLKPIDASTFMDLN